MIREIVVNRDFSARNIPGQIRLPAGERKEMSVGIRKTRAEMVIMIRLQRGFLVEFGLTTKAVM